MCGNLGDIMVRTYLPPTDARTDAVDQVRHLHVRMTDTFREALFREAEKANVSLSEMLIRRACRGLGIAVEDAVPSRRVPGRKPKGRGRG